MHPIIYITLFFLVVGTPSAILVFSLHKLGLLSFFSPATGSGGIDSMVTEHEVLWYVLVPTMIVLGPVLWVTVFVAGKSEIKQLKQLKLEQVAVTSSK